MILVDKALEAREQEGRPIRVGMIGAGQVGQGLANQIINSVRGMRLSAVYNRHTERAHHVYRYAGRDDILEVANDRAMDEAIWRGQSVVAEDPFAICRSDQIDVVVDVTGAVDFGAQVILEAFKHGKPVILLNAEVDATIGPILQTYARKYGTIMSAADGDEP